VEVTVVVREGESVRQREARERRGRYDARVALVVLHELRRIRAGEGPELPEAASRQLAAIVVDAAEDLQAQVFGIDATQGASVDALGEATRTRPAVRVEGVAAVTPAVGHEAHPEQLEVSL